MRRSHRALMRLAPLGPSCLIGTLLALAMALGGGGEREPQARRAAPGEAGVLRAESRGSERDERRVPTALPARRQRSLDWPRLDPIEPEATAISVTVAGTDPLAPRALTLWRVDGTQPLPLSSVVSRADGRFDFGQLALPNAGLALSVTPEGVDPRSPSPVGPRASELPQPHVSFGERDAGGLSLLVLPALGAGVVSLIDEQGTTIDRLGLEANGAERAGATLQLAIAPPTGRLFVVHELPDGRRSRPLEVADFTAQSR